MSGFYEDYSDDLDGNGRQEETGSGLRAQLEQALAEMKSLRGELAELKTGRRTDTVTGLLESKGIDPAVAQLIPSEADAKEWLDQFGHLFGKNLDEGNEPGELPTPEEEPDPDLLAEQEAWEAANGLSNSGTPVAVSNPIEKLNSFESEADLLAFLSEQGAGPTSF